MQRNKNYISTQDEKWLITLLGKEHATTTYKEWDMHTHKEN